MSELENIREQILGWMLAECEEKHSPSPDSPYHRSEGYCPDKAADLVESLLDAFFEGK